MPVPAMAAAANAHSPMWGQGWYAEDDAQRAARRAPPRWQQAPERRRAPGGGGGAARERAAFDAAQIPGLGGNGGGGEGARGQPYRRQYEEEDGCAAPAPAEQAPRRAPSRERLQGSRGSSRGRLGSRERERGAAPAAQAPRQKMHFDDWLAKAEGRTPMPRARDQGTRLPELRSPSVAGSVAGSVSVAGSTRSNVPRLAHNRPKGMRGKSPPGKPGSMVGDPESPGSLWRPDVQRHDLAARQRHSSGHLGAGMLPTEGAEAHHTPSKARRRGPEPFTSPPDGRGGSRAPSEMGSYWEPSSAPAAHGPPPGWGAASPAPSGAHSHAGVVRRGVGAPSEAGSRKTNLSRMSWMSRRTNQSLAHQSSSNVSNIFNPVRGIRDEMRRAGYQPIDHHRHNMRVLRDQSRRNRESRRLPPLPENGGRRNDNGGGANSRLFRARAPPKDRFAAIREQHRTQRGGDGGGGGRGAARRLAPMDSDEAADIARQEEERRVRVREERRRREEEASARADYDEAKRRAPPGTTLMPEEERLATLEVVTRRAAVARRAMRAARTAAEQQAIERELDEMEEAIGIFSKRHVWIRTDDADDQQQGEEDY